MHCRMLNPAAYRRISINLVFNKHIRGQQFLLETRNQQNLVLSGPLKLLTRVYTNPICSKFRTKSTGLYRSSKRIDTVLN